MYAQRLARTITGLALAATLALTACGSNPTGPTDGGSTQTPTNPTPPPPPIGTPPPPPPGG